MIQKMMMVALLLVIASCSDSNNSEYQLSPELKEKAKAAKQEMLESNSANGTQKSEKSEKPELDPQTSPKWVAEEIFKAARTANYAILSQFCDPMGESDQKAQRLCSVPTMTPEDQNDFMAYFKLGKVVQDPVITGDRASVPIKFGYDGNADQTLTMIMRAGKWYLLSF